MTVQDKDQPGSPNWLAKFTILEGDPRGAFSIHPDPLTNEGVISLVKVRKGQALLQSRGSGEWGGAVSGLAQEGLILQL